MFPKVEKWIQLSLQYIIELTELLQIQYFFYFDTSKNCSAVVLTIFSDQFSIVQISTSLNKLNLLSYLHYNTFLDDKKSRHSLFLQKCRLFILSALPKIADFISRFEFSFLRFLIFFLSIFEPYSLILNGAISNNLLRFCILFRFRELHFLRDR